MSQINLVIAANDNVMMVPRILQILSRRGYRLTKLETTQTDGQTLYRCRVEGEERWQASMAGLIAKLPDVERVDHE